MVCYDVWRMNTQTTVDLYTHANRLPDNFQHTVVQEDTTLKTILVTFVIGLIVGGTILVIFTSIWRMHLKSQKAAEIASASLTNARAGCNMGETVSAAKGCTYIIIQERAHGSGISIGKGYIVTNKHVVEGGTTFSTRIGTEVVPLDLVKSSDTNDIALLKAKTDLPTCPFFTSDKLAQAEEVFAVGWPKERDQIEPAFTRGVFSRFNTQSDNIKYIQTDAAINPGNSGGSLINECGIVGMNTAKFSWFDKETPTEGLGLAMPIELVLELVRELQK